MYKSHSSALPKQHSLLVTGLFIWIWGFSRLRKIEKNYNNFGFKHVPMVERTYPPACPCCQQTMLKCPLWWPNVLRGDVIKCPVSGGTVMQCVQLVLFWIFGALPSRQPEFASVFLIQILLLCSPGQIMCWNFGRNPVNLFYYSYQLHINIVMDFSVDLATHVDGWLLSKDRLKKLWTYSLFCSFVSGENNCCVKLNIAFVFRGMKWSRDACTVLNWVAVTNLP